MAKARRIAAEAPASAWPDLPAFVTLTAASLPSHQGQALLDAVRLAMNEMYLCGALYCASTSEGSAEVNGVRLTFPALVEAWVFDATRLLSFEGLLPVFDEVPPAVWRMLADRFRGLAALCDQIRTGDVPGVQSER